MPFASGPSPDESPEAQFRQVLTDVRRAAARRAHEPREDSAATCSSANPLASTIFPVDDNGQQAAGGASRWHAALDWLEEQDGPAVLVESTPVADEGPEAILAELGLTENLTDQELSRLRRLYMWRNHPDRHRESQRANATRRVAIANMLLDRARSRLAANRRP
jgi:hypothetical protein